MTPSSHVCALGYPDRFLLVIQQAGPGMSVRLKVGQSKLFLELEKGEKKGPGSGVCDCINFPTISPER